MPSSASPRSRARGLYSYQIVAGLAAVDAKNFLARCGALAGTGQSARLIRQMLPAPQELSSPMDLSVLNLVRFVDHQAPEPIYSSGVQARR
jgi:hypothetical protein